MKASHATLMKEKQIARFWRGVPKGKSTDCWEWLGTRNPVSHYGQVRFDGALARAHRVSWILHRGKIPKGLCVLHKCDNPPCVNPNHLFVGTHNDNVQDKIRKGRFPCIGEGCHLAKLTAKEVIEIRQAKNVSLDALAAKYGICNDSIQNVRYGRTWKHVHPLNHRLATNG